MHSSSLIIKIIQMGVFPSLLFPLLTLGRQYLCPYALPPSDVFIAVSLLGMQAVWLHKQQKESADS
jgi:hypothetical protein